MLDFNKLKKKHKKKPFLLKHNINVKPVYLPNKVMLEFKSEFLKHKTNIKLEDLFTVDILELYFSNQRRSGGHDVKNIQFDTDKDRVIVSFADHASKLYFDVTRILNEFTQNRNYDTFLIKEACRYYPNCVCWLLF